MVEKIKQVCFIALTAALLACGGGGGGSTTSGGGSGTPTPSNVPEPPANPSTLVSHWWNQAVFYEVFVRSFADSETGNKANDGIGDLRGLIERLPYLNDGNPNTTTDLGVTALWLMPIMQSPSYHGYDATDYYTVEFDYGTNQDFRDLIDAAHAVGIRVIIDLVLNHASNQHARFINSRQANSEYRDWFIWEDNNPGGQGPWGQTVWHRNSGSWYYGLFWSGMPDWNYFNPDVTAYMYDVSRFWLQDMGADGFRLDAIRYLHEVDSTLEDTQETHDWLTDYYNYYKSIKPQAFTVGEVWADSDIVAAYKGQMDTNFQFDLASAILAAANSSNGSQLEAQINRAFDNFDTNQFSTFITNHDQNRVMTQLGGDVAKAKLAGTILLTLPGVPFVYYGEEIGMTGAKPDEFIRTPLQWDGGANAGFSTATPWFQVNNDFPSVNIARQSSDSTSLLSLYRNLIHLRNNHNALAIGNYTPVETSSGNILAFLRQSTTETVLVIINLANVDQSNYSIALNADYDNAVELLQGANLAKGEEVTSNGVDGFRPITNLSARTGYIIGF